ncbi:hypothetical protein [Celeribacter arenosi]|uniref:Uncharacterized protein n=1 Tax=Celeribacter arenosi TaxID=792649 RepID=A0ABP7KER5_9RHOB
MSNFEDLNKEKFTEEFLEAYLENGFTTMTKREIDLLVLRLLVDHREIWDWDTPPTAFEMSRDLRAKRSRIRSMMDELSFRMLASEDNAKARLRALILKQCENEGDAITHAGSIRLQIEDGFLRDYAKSLVQTDFGIVDTSFDRTIITLSGAKFLSLIASLFDKRKKEALHSELKKVETKIKKSGGKSLWRCFLESVAQGAGKEVGSKAVRLGLAALTGGVSEIATLVDGLTNEMESPGQGAASGGTAV